MAGNAGLIFQKNGSDVLDTSAAPVPQGLPCKEAHARTKRCSHASSGQRTLVAFAALFTVSVVVLLVTKCYNALNGDYISRGGAKQRSLSNGGYEYCVGDANESSSYDRSSDYSLLNDVAQQRDLLQLDMPDMLSLSQSEGARISVALGIVCIAIAADESLKILVEGMKGQADISHRLFDKISGVRGSVNQRVATLRSAFRAGKKRLEVALAKYEEHKKVLYSLAYDPNQKKLAAFLMLNALASGRKLSDTAAKGLAAAERVLYPEKRFSFRMSDYQSLLLHILAHEKLNKLENWVSTLSRSKNSGMGAQERAALADQALEAIEDTALLLLPLRALGEKYYSEMLRKPLGELDSLMGEISADIPAKDSMLGSEAQQKTIGGPSRRLIPNSVKPFGSLNEVENISKNLLASMAFLLDYIKKGGQGSGNLDEIIEAGRAHYFLLDASLPSMNANQRLHSEYKKMSEAYRQALEALSDLVPWAYWEPLQSGEYYNSEHNESQKLSEV
ncbi:hypothetical protein cyc_04689 [Cyclospora cayetanensis]|uniref:Uncharacterized protein n=1 Tax=Cyclospora cayetanensis TaxID=88456 RepID=A0A1D3CRF8_9EIME|nr:hypothetical protein cyc_04689 [Cyclospora cayetanensis]